MLHDFDTDDVASWLKLLNVLNPADENEGLAAVQSGKCPINYYISMTFIEESLLGSISFKCTHA